MTLNRQALLTDLERDEGLRLRAYDDATGSVLLPGYQLKGHPTIRIDAILAQFAARPPWALKLPEPQIRALPNLAFNVGSDGMLGFSATLAALQVGNPKQAVASKRPLVTVLHSAGRRSTLLVCFLPRWIAPAQAASLQSTRAGTFHV